MVLELMNELLEEGKRQFNENLRLRDPITHLENQVKLMYARHEISAQEYHHLIQKVRQRQIGRGDLEIIHRKAMRNSPTTRNGTPAYPSPTTQRSLNQLALDRVRLEDMQYEAQTEIDSLRASLKEFKDQAAKVHQKAQKNLTDEQAVRELLDQEHDFQERAQKLDDRIQSLAQGLERLKTVIINLEAYETELKSLDIEERLAGATLDIRERTWTHKK